MRYGDLSYFQSGVAVPLFSLYSKQSIGIGEYLDLIPFARWAQVCDFNIIQLLPVNDTGAESSPYSARSAFALNPVFINVQAVDGSSEYEEEIHEAKAKFDAEGKIDYYKISTWKRSILRKIFDNRYDYLKKDKVLTRWIDSNSWAKPYCVYATLKAQNGESSWKDWAEYRNPTDKDIEKLWKKFIKDCLFQAWMQCVAEMQFNAAVTEVSNMGLRLKGDIPILINEDSADVWSERRFFSLDDRAGAPPDMFSYSGQNWGFPTYRWDVIEQDNFDWWRRRLAQASKFYHAYRIDHVLGFFRIWSIPQCEVTGIMGRFNPCIPLTLNELQSAGFCQATLEYLRRPNYSIDQLRGFLGDDTDRLAPVCFQPLEGEFDRLVLKPEFSSEKAILSMGEPQEVKDKLLKVYWNRVFIPSGDENTFYPYWYWYNQPVLFTLPENEQQKLREILKRNEDSQNGLWEQNATKLLSVLAKETDMLVCAEDLGAVPSCVPTVLNKLNILSLRIERWARNWNVPYSPYYDMDEYPRLSVCTTSCHDTSSLRGLWKEPDFDRGLYWSHAHLPGSAPQEITPTVARTILTHVFSSNSLFCILPAQDYFALSASLSQVDPEKERVNVPGTVGGANWCYRLPCSVDELLDYASLSSDIRKLVDVRKRRPLWKF
ncbi:MULTISPECIES: 4-alpha-glucanotransferase [unclassified Fibrobacter]|uniref:4-alpha-glucanotransferase n=1 Tax=unclassified Fibrobacter TaxID=2634177 RepID=UPI00091ABA78|nr:MULTISPECIES: 4-alpha-glucanotransferase [unclassified Fibrobacter]MCQ2099896.1 4-alpha-glucanotransferase [Fibrobacter sp.]OWV02868.1 4-alpha-glucanotransferase [Fibrobacter sp. UWH3]SHK92832.1 4-alpha-glucanotransferase [Fibrobacter sp. UWH5]SHL15475.1 4-alpha-glucanotransferase [Fibrobacter sp. UWH6]